MKNMISENKNREKKTPCRLVIADFTEDLTVSTFRLAHKPCRYLITNKHGVTYKQALIFTKAPPTRHRFFSVSLCL